MSRPTSKDQLLSQAQEEYAALIRELDALTDAQKIAPDTVGAWSVKDVLAHLTEWMRMVLRWYEAGTRGETPITPGEGYTWQQIPALNQRIYEQYRDTPLDEINAGFHSAYHAVMDALAQISNDVLFTPKVYPWTKTTTLGSYFTSATSSHYAWARKEIRKGIKAKQKAG